MQVIAVIAAVLAALGSLFAAMAAWKSAKASRTATEASILSDFMKEYGSDQMTTDLRILRTYFEINGDDFSRVWITNLKYHVKTPAKGEAHRVDRARRHVKFFFISRAYKLYREKLISIKIMKQICALDGITILFTIVEPLEFSLNPDYNKTMFDELKTLCGQSATKKLIQPILPEDAR